LLSVSMIRVSLFLRLGGLFVVCVLVCLWCVCVSRQSAPGHQPDR
jgi:hypothetical protein